MTLTMAASLLVSLLGVSAVPSAHAIVGNLAEEGGSNTTCRILIRGANDKLIGICSATLLSPTRLDTAAHCLPRNGEYAEIACGYKGRSNEKKRIEYTAGGSKVITQGLAFKETLKRAGLRDLRSSTEKTHSGFAITPAFKSFSTFASRMTSKDVSQVFDLKKSEKPRVVEMNIKPGAECRIEGYGINNNGVSGILTTAPGSGTFFFDLSTHEMSTFDFTHLSGVEAKDLVALEEAVANHNSTSKPTSFFPLNRSIQKLGLIDGKITFGDSGGPIYCRPRRSAPWKLYGVTQKFAVLIDQGYFINIDTFSPPERGR